MNNQEIERKFLVAGDYLPHVTSSTHIVQGYIAHENGRSVRVRIRDDRAYLTLKGPSNEAGMSRFEWEREITVEEARALMTICQGGFIDKTRSLVPFGGHTFEVDEFHGANAGLVMAEVEVSSEQEEVQLPDWIGQEVTGDRRYYNSHLLKNPYCLWKSDK